jgi:hypothetical protein
VWSLFLIPEVDLTQSYARTKRKNAFKNWWKKAIEAYDCGADSNGADLIDDANIFTIFSSACKPDCDVNSPLLYSLKRYVLQNSKR